MKEIGRDEYVIKALSGRNSILDAVLKRIAIFTEGETLMVELEFEMRASSDYHRVILKFVDVSEYSFYHNDTYLFYNIEHFKFLRLANGLYYISLDPHDEAKALSNEDQDLVVARSVSGYEIEKS